MNIKLAIFLILNSSFVLSVDAGSATWNMSATSSDWNTSSNWTPATIPNGPSDTATFAKSQSKNVSISAATEVSGISFSAGADPFVVTALAQQDLTISGTGITNSSGMTQSFVVAKDPAHADPGEILFTNSATAGSQTAFTIMGAQGPYESAGAVGFLGSSRADHASFIITPSTHDAFISGKMFFYDSASADNATITAHFGDIDFVGTPSAGNATITIDATILFFTASATAGNSVITASNGSQTLFRETTSAGHVTLTNNGAYTEFSDSATAANGLFINNGASSSSTYPSSMLFGNGPGTPTLDNATLIANGGSNGGEGAYILLSAGSLGGTSRIEVFANGSVDIGGHFSPGITIGSLAGDGQVLLGLNNLTIGSNNLSTTFSGIIQDDGGAGSVTKIGTGRLILANANTYTGGTTLNGGILLANNTTGSGLGTGPVQALAGILGGSGIISGRVTMGTGRGSGATLGPGANSIVPGILTIRKQLAFKSDATYRVTLNSDTPAADLVIANGVRILGAQIVLLEMGSRTLPTGTVLTVISNTGRKPISGTFANLPDGGQITAGSNTYQANYEGGDGNDLTLTVL